MASIVVSGDTSGAITLQAPAVAGSTTLNLPASSGTVLTQNSSAPANSFVVDASGNVGIGTSSPSYKLQVSTSLPTGVSLGALDSSSFVSNGIAFRSLGNQAGISGTTYAKQIFAGGSPDNMEIYNGANYPLVFGTNATERMRIDASGNVLVGRTSTGFDKTAYGWQISRDAESFVTVNTAASCITFNRNNNGDIFKFFRDGTQRGWISVETTGTTYGNLSDKRVKENFADAPEALPKINELQVKSFDWKEGGHTDYGFVAQDLNTVLPFAVTVGDDGEEVEKAWGVDNTKIVPVLVKAIQELKAIVDEQAEKIKALEAK